MNYMRSNVKVILGIKAYDILKENCLKTNKQEVMDIVLAPDDFTKAEDYILIGWENIMWSEDFEEIVTVKETLSQLDELVEKNAEKIKDYFYKIIQIEDTNYIMQDSNDLYEEYTSDFYVICNFSM